jgi:hypothetical protein
MSTGHVKLMLLLLGTISFAAVWSNDQSPVSLERRELAGKVERSSRIAQEPATVQLEFPALTVPTTDNDVSMESLQWLRFPTALHATIPEPAEQNETDSTWVMLEELEFVRIDAFENPLPRAIAPGEYRVIDRFGHVATQSISLEIALATGFEIGSVERDSYTARENEDRWHFIRIERDLIAERESNLQSNVRNAWKTVFRVIGNQTERPLQDLRRPIENWLAPQDMADDRSTVRR